MYTGANIVRNGLILALDAANTKSYPGSGTVWSDLSGTAVTGSLTNGPTFNSANNGSIVFDGTNDYVDCSSFNTSSLTTEATLICWLRCNSNSPSSGQTGLFGFDNVTFRSNYVWTDGKAYIGTFKNNRVDSITLSNIDRTTPHMLSVTTKSGSLWRFYQNTTLVTSTTAEATISINSLNRNIGIKRAGDGFLFSGRFYYFTIYNRALSASEILQNYNALKSRFNL